MTEHRNDPARHAIGEEAAKWVLEAPTADVAQRAALVAWLKSSPVHIEEFLFATATLKELRRGVQTDSGEIDRIIADALTSAGAPNVVRLHPQEPAETPRTPRFWSGIRIAMTAAAVALIAVVCGLLAYTRMVEVEVYATGVGEQRTIRLPDGSLVYLNARSQLQVRFSRTLREIELTEGESIFHVAHESNRPFRVRVGSAVVEALGTRFNVSRRGTEATVSVLEGNVRVGADEGAARHLSLAAGQQARIVAGHISDISLEDDADIARAVAWRERRLVFRDDRLENVAEEFGRYSPRRIRLEGHAAREQRITGTFDADDPEALVLFLEGVEGLTVEREAGDFTVRSR